MAAVKKNARTRQELTNIEKARRKLVQHFFHTHPNRWVNGIAIGFMPPPPLKADSIREARRKPREKPKVVISVSPSTPSCEMCCIEEVCEETGQLCRIDYSSRVVGLADSGASIGPDTSDLYNVPLAVAGTLGGFVEVSGKQYLLGSNHVLAYNGRVPNGTPKDTDVKNPGAVEDATGGLPVAKLSYFVDLVPPAWPSNVTPSVAPPNRADCALAELTPQGLPPGAMPIDPLPPVFAPQSNPSLAPTLIPLPVTARVRHRHGLVPPTTSSTITLFEWSGLIDLSFGTYYFERMMAFDQLLDLTTSTGHDDIFAVPGDSGAMVVVDAAAPSFSGMGAGLLTARSFLFDSSNSNQFLGYRFVVCALDSIAEDLPKAMNQANGTNLTKSDLKFFI